MPNREWPSRVRIVSGEKGSSRDVDILDADTGERFQGVMKVTIQPTGDFYEITVYATEHWPISNADLDVYYAEATEDKPTIDGVITMTRTYRIKSIAVDTLGWE
jgi:hypothetical protein